MNGLEKIVARMEADTRAECDALTASAAENAAAILRDCRAQADAVAATAASGRRLRRRSIWSTSTAAASWPAAKKCWPPSSS